MENNKPLEDKTIIERHTVEGKFNLGSALNEQDVKIKALIKRLDEAEKALGFMANWWEENFGNKLFLPTQDQIKQINDLK